ncbi:MAG: S8 family serine peptidase, partial [Chloroflexi bacterium]|nr:S8 family serine peptidase [Chloroflexota bacterium]
MARRFSVALVLLVFMALLLPGNLLPTNRAEAQEPPRDSKISGLLALQVEGKRQAVRAGRLPATVRPATAEVPQQGGLIDTFQPQAAGLADLTRQQIFLHLAQKPTQSQIAELQADNVTLHLDSWIPPVGNHPTGFILADMPVDKLETLAGRGYVARMETAERLLEEQNDLAAQKINADDVWASGYDGAGVKIAVLDSGLDLTHPDFPTPVAKKDYSNYPALDDNVISPVSGHGTHVTGSALGRGTQSGGVYKGSAPGADLIFLKVGRDDGSIPLSAITNAIRDAVDVYNADVITMSIGGWDTYHDGTGEDAQAVDYAFSQGAVVLIAAGNESNDSQHYSGTVAGGSATDFISVNVTGAGTNDTSLQFNLVWFDGTGVSNDLVMEYYNSAQTLVASTNLAQSQSSRGTESELSYYNLYVPAGNSIWYLKVRNNSSNSQFFHIYYDLGGSRVKFDSPDVNYTITSPSDADSAIAVGAYTTRKVWYDYANNGWQSASETVDQIATFSSRGPRVDTGAPGKPNIVAPGKNIISTRDNVAYPWANRGTYYVDNDGPNRSNASGGSNDSNGPADYYVMGGTSMATPIAAGVAALILQKNPGWTPAQVKNALESTATDKGTTGWDGTYGWGLVNALAAVTEPTSVTTGNATNITSNSASLSGNLTSLGSASSANVSFDWGTTSGSLIYETAHITTNLTGSFSANITGLSANTTYYFRAKAVGDGTSYGNTANFTTLPVIPLSVVTNNATNITTNSVRLNGNLTSLGSASSANVSFVFGTGPGVYTFETQIVSLSFTGSFSINVTGLSPNTYYFRAKAAGDGTAYGNELSFNIPVPTPPTVVTTNATNITTNSARVSGNLTSLGSASSANVSFDWGTTSGSLIYETANITTNLTGSFSANITGLSANTTYYFRAKAVGDGTSYGTTDNFTTLAPSPPVANDDAAMTDEDTAVSIAVLANDSDVDGDLLVTTVNITAGPANGQASVNSATGSVTYTPAANFYGTDNFTYRVSDTSGLFDTATVTITVFSVNDPPVARDDA